MRQEHFIARHQAEWQAFDAWLDARGGRPRRARADRDWRGMDDSAVPAAYRRLTQQLGLARRRGYSPQLVERLQALVQRGHDVMYRPPPPRWRRSVEFLLADFPRLVRAERGAMAAALLMFALPLVLSYVAVQVRPELIHTLFEPVQLAQMEAMYDPAASKLGRDSGDDLQMFGYYVMNNVSIGLRSFASGLLAGIGPVLVLGMNGLMIGGMAGHLQGVGLGDPFWRFVAGHGAFELTAIVIAGGAGLRLGLGDAALECLLGYRWPGNVRQLRHVLRYACALCSGASIRLEDLPQELRGVASVAPRSESPASPERQALLEALVRHRWQPGPAAAALGISRATLYRRVKQQGIEMPRVKRETVER